MESEAKKLVLTCRARQTSVRVPPHISACYQKILYAVRDANADLEQLKNIVQVYKLHKERLILLGYWQAQTTDLFEHGKGDSDWFNLQSVFNEGWATLVKRYQQKNVFLQEKYKRRLERVGVLRTLILNELQTEAEKFECSSLSSSSSATTNERRTAAFSPTAASFASVAPVTTATSIVPTPSMTSPRLEIDAEEESASPGDTSYSPRGDTLFSPSAMLRAGLSSLLSTRRPVPPYSSYFLSNSSPRGVPPMTMFHNLRDVRRPPSPSSSTLSSSPLLVLPEGEIIVAATGSTNVTSDYDITYWSSGVYAPSFQIGYFVFWLFYAIWNQTTSHACDTNLYAPSAFFVVRRASDYPAALSSATATTEKEAVAPMAADITSLSKRNLASTTPTTSPSAPSISEVSASPSSASSDPFSSSVSPPLLARCDRLVSYGRTSLHDSDKLTGMYLITLPIMTKIYPDSKLLVFTTDDVFFRTQLRFLMGKMTRVARIWDRVLKPLADSLAAKWPSQAELLTYWYKQGALLNKGADNLSVAERYTRAYLVGQEVGEAYRKWVDSPAMYIDTLRLAALRLNYFAVEAYACVSTIYHVVLEFGGLSPKGLKLTAYDYALSMVENWIDLLLHLQELAHEQQQQQEEAKKEQTTESIMVGVTTDSALLKVSKYVSRIVDAFQKSVRLCLPLRSSGSGNSSSGAEDVERWLTSVQCLSRNDNTDDQVAVGSAADTVATYAKKVNNMRKGATPYDSKTVFGLFNALVNKCRYDLSPARDDIESIADYRDALLPVFASHLMFVITNFL